MQRVSLRTLILTLELLVAVVALQYLTVAKPAKADVIWLAANCHTASSIQRGGADPIVTTPAPATAAEGTREP